MAARKPDDSTETAPSRPAVPAYARLRLRAELDERDFGGIKIGQTVLVRSAAFREREFAGKVLSIAPIVQSSRISSRDQRNLTDVSVAEVIVDLAEPGPLTVGMKVDVYFRRDNP